MLKIPWLGRGLSKVVKLRERGLCTNSACGSAGGSRGSRWDGTPTRSRRFAPAVRVKKRTATTIEIKVVAVRGRFGNADDVIVEEPRSTPSMRRIDGVDATDLISTMRPRRRPPPRQPPGKTMDIRARASNVRGAGPWSAPLQATALLKPNAFYGGDCGEFSWRQTPETVTCVIELPKGRKDVVVEAARDTLTAGLKASRSSTKRGSCGPWRRRGGRLSTAP